EPRPNERCGGIGDAPFYRTSGYYPWRRWRQPPRSSEPARQPPLLPRDGGRGRSSQRAQRRTDWPWAVALYTYGGTPRLIARPRCFVTREIASSTRRFVFTAYSDIPSSSASSTEVASGRVER